MGFSKKTQIATTTTWVVAFVIIFFLIIIYLSLSLLISVGRSVPILGKGESEIKIESGKVYDLASIKILTSLARENNIEGDLGKFSVIYDNSDYIFFTGKSDDPDFEKVNIKKLNPTQVSEIYYNVLRGKASNIEFIKENKNLGLYMNFEQP